MRASTELQFGALREVWRHARGREHYRGKPGGALSGRYAPNSAKAEGSSIADEPGIFLREKLISDHGLFSSYEDQQGAVNGQGCTGLWTAGRWLARRLHQLKASTTMDLGISIFLISIRCVALRNLGLSIKTDWSVIRPLCG